MGLLRYLAVVVLAMVVVSFARLGQDSYEMGPLPFGRDENREFFLPFYMHKKSFSEKMRSVKGRVANNMLRDTLFG